MKRLLCRRLGLLWFLCTVAVVNILAIYSLMSKPCDVTDVQTSALCSSANCVRAEESVQNSGESVAFIFREFEYFVNDVPGTVESFRTLHSEFLFLIVADTLPYPPLKLSHFENVHLVCLQGALDKPASASRPDSVITSDYVIIVPDGIRMDNRFSIKYMVEFLENHRKLNPSISIAAWPLNPTVFSCVELHVDIKRWTVNHRVLQNGTICDAVEGDQFVLLLKKQILVDLPFPFMRPLQPAIFIQNALRGHKVVVDKRKVIFFQSTVLFNDSHNKWKHKKKEQTRLREALSSLGIKRIQFSTGSVEWYGCGKETVRCFGTVVDDVPEFIYQNRWTPPCCLQALRITARHVFKILQEQGVRFWLEGGSLLGAARSGDIIPWDYDVDIGIYRDDIGKSKFLINCQTEPYEDDYGFVWERATEGDFFRVQYSQTNRLHVDIFPFHSVNGTMTKNTWFRTHRQDREFPESFLRPLSRISFIGTKAPAPNNVREFLEFKFGHGVIENPKYPNSQPV